MGEDKPFDATPQRRARAKREGDVPRSADANALASLACAAGATFALMPFARVAAGNALAAAARAEMTPGPYVVLGGGAVAVCMSALAGALGATYLQTQSFSFKFPAPNIAKLNPMQGLKKMFSRDALLAAAKAIIVTCALCAALSPSLREAFAARGDGVSPGDLGLRTWRALGLVFAWAIVVASMFAAIDAVLERYKWRRRLRMSYDELKRDMRQSEGDPHQKGRRRQVQRSLARGSIGRLKEAAFVVTNPTHVAIALEYDPPHIGVPRVLIRAVDAGAREVKRRARELRVPIIENVALARALLATADVGEFIPPSAYAAVAAIVAALAREKALAG